MMINFTILVFCCATLFQSITYVLRGFWLTGSLYFFMFMTPLLVSIGTSGEFGIYGRLANVAGILCFVMSTLIVIAFYKTEPNEEEENHAE